MSPNEPTKKKNGGHLSATRSQTILGLQDELDSKRSVIPLKWEKHRKRLLALRSHLEAERRNHALAVKEPLETFSMNMADAATDEFDHNLALSQLSAERAALYEIDEALARIANGTYGICENTGRPIPEARLNALPWTRFTGDVERQMEHKGQIDHARLGQLRSVSGRIRGELTEAKSSEELPEPPPTDESLFPHKASAKQ
jgi:RNA polymerase-binding protein DksA